jgi:hypothetical protein
MEGYSVSKDATTADHEVTQATARRARKTGRRRALTLLNEMNALKVQKAIGRAPQSRTVTTKDGTVRTYRIGQNVASMCSWLLFREGKGHLPGGWVYKSETELTAPSNSRQNPRRTRVPPR